MQPVRIGNVECHVQESDITAIHADTMLIPVPQTHAGKGGVFESAKLAGAIRGCEALENWHVNSSEFMRLGDVLTVSAGGGNTKFLSHAASVCEFGEGRDHNFAAVVLSVQSVLEDMARKKLASVTIPLMGTGELGWLNEEQSAKAMAIAVSHFTQAHPEAHIKIHFAVQDRDKAEILQKTLETPEQYNDVSTERILAEKGKRIPPLALLETHRATGTLAMRLNNAPPKYASRGTNNLGGRY